MTKSYYRGASACLLVYDITRRASFEPLEQWLSDARSLASPDLRVVVVGNKLDCQEDRQVSFQEARDWALQHKCQYMETSSLNGDNVERPFVLACQSILAAIQSGNISPEKPGSGISYGDRGLRSVAVNSSNKNSKFTFTEVMPNGNRSGAVSLQTVKSRFDGCC